MLTPPEGRGEPLPRQGERAHLPSWLRVACAGHSRPQLTPLPPALRSSGGPGRTTYLFRAVPEMQPQAAQLLETGSRLQGGANAARSLDASFIPGLQFFCPWVTGLSSVGLRHEGRGLR